MHLQLIAAPEYTVATAVKKIRSLQEDFVMALNLADWEKIRYLDSVCILVVERTRVVSRQDKSALLAALSELKDIYEQVILHCEKINEAIC